MDIEYDNEFDVWCIVNSRGVVTDEYETEQDARDAIIECKRANAFHREAYGFD